MVEESVNVRVNWSAHIAEPTQPVSCAAPVLAKEIQAEYDGATTSDEDMGYGLFGDDDETPSFASLNTQQEKATMPSYDIPDVSLAHSIQLESDEAGLSESVSALMQTSLALDFDDLFTTEEEEESLCSAQGGC